MSNNTNIEGMPFDIDVNLTFLNNGMTKPVAMGFRGDISADIKAGNIDVQNISFNVTPDVIARRPANTRAKRCRYV